MAHADWTFGNLRLHDGRVSCSCDWDSLAAAPEPVLVGLAAGCFTEGSSAGATTPTTVEVTGFLRDDEQVRSHPFRAAGQRTAAAAVTWLLAYNARCELSLLPLDGGPARGSPLHALTTQPDAYLNLRWTRAYATGVVGGSSLALAGPGPRLVTHAIGTSGTQQSPAVHRSPWSPAGILREQGRLQNPDRDQIPAFARAPDCSSSQAPSP